MFRCFFENIFEILLLPGSYRLNHNLRHESYPQPKAWKINQAFGLPNTNGNLLGKTRNVENNYAVFSYMFRLIIVACLISIVGKEERKIRQEPLCLRFGRHERIYGHKKIKEK